MIDCSSNRKLELALTAMIVLMAVTGACVFVIASENKPKLDTKRSLDELSWISDCALMGSDVGICTNKAKNLRDLGYFGEAEISPTIKLQDN